MFVGRENDLRQLESLWAKPVASLVTCRGRRRIGKSTLIEEFARRSKAVFLKLEGIAPEPRMTNVLQLKAFREQLSRECGRSVPMLKSWGEAFAELDRCIGSSKTVLLLDEISWMGRYDVGFPGELKIAWDNLFKKHDRLIVFFCGSVSTWISRNILNNTGFVGRASLNLVVRELPLEDCVRFWGRKASRVATSEILDVLSVTGGVPRYLEEVNPSFSANENVRRLCFVSNALLRDDFNQTFNVVFGEEAVTKRRILMCLSDASRTLSEICEALGVERNGGITVHLEDLEVAGFVTCERSVNPQTGRSAKICRYRICDNYTRFFLRYIEPNGAMIDVDSFLFNSLEALPGWTAILGLQFENLVINNLALLLPLLGLGRVLLKSAAPYRQAATSRRKGCQIDLLLQSDRLFYVVEIKRRREIGIEIEDEVAEKVAALHVPQNYTVRTALVYDGHLSPQVAARGYFDALVPASMLLGREKLLSDVCTGRGQTPVVGFE